MKPTLTLLTVALFFRAAHSQESPPMVVHEWGTFTSLQNESGQAIGGLNTDDEPVPNFVHTTLEMLVPPTQLPPSFLGKAPGSVGFFGKGIPGLHLDVTMRLETPVMYFYPPEGTIEPVEMDVKASFRGGWLTEYYPQAMAETPGLVLEQGGGIVVGGINERTMGSLTWEGLRIGVEANPPQTDAEVWLAPRRVRAASVSTPNGESEKYLFYRGIGHLDAMLRVYRSADGEWLDIRRQPFPTAGEPTGATIGSSWLAHIRADGSCAFLTIGALEMSGEIADVLARVPAHFAESEFSPSNLKLLRADMHRALVAEGLFADEADAMLDTWQEAYFHSPGLRLFFTVPQEWTDHFLPLEFSAPVELTRIMVGRIEVVTPKQRALLAEIAARPVESFPTETLAALFEEDGGGERRESEIFQRVQKGTLDLEELGVPLPATFAAYLDLGRLRNALILNEQAVRPTSHLRDFINNHRLSGYQPPATAESQETVVREEWDHTLPARFALEQNYPNPFNSETSLRFALPQPTTVKLAVYNLAGQQVAQLVYGPRPAGLYAVHWDGRSDAGRSLATGVYLYRLQTESQTLTRKLLLLR